MATRRRRRGFTKTLAEEMALELRAELGLEISDRLDPSALAAHLLIPIIVLDDVVGLDPATERFFTHGAGRSMFSAATINIDGWRGIVINPSHAPTRQGNSVCHEVGHVLLEHEPEAPLSMEHGRSWNREHEQQADYIAGALLIPRDAAHAAALAGQEDRDVALQFGVSVAVARMRLQKTGARLRARRRAELRAQW